MSQGRNARPMVGLYDSWYCCMTCSRGVQVKENDVKRLNTGFKINSLYGLVYGV